MADDELAGRLLEALAALDDVCGELTADEAVAELDEGTLQVFWRDWPNISAWAGSVWRRLDKDLAQPARPAQDSDLDEVGGSG
ncbi:MAG TPA: hypothetical protein VFA83_22015 [Acidimicrobiales bacterium]|nr:hypothetical protein [Acidimicrobiales bacterium]